VSEKTPLVDGYFTLGEMPKTNRGVLWSFLWSRFRIDQVTVKFQLPFGLAEYGKTGAIIPHQTLIQGIYKRYTRNT